MARFNNFGFVQSARDALVSMEIFNSGDDYLFKGWGDGATSPLNACLNAGWRTGLTGVSDHHGTTWGQAEGQGAAGCGCWRTPARGGQEALRARRVFASIYSGVRLDATANGIRMGNDVTLPGGNGTVTFQADFDRGAEWFGKPLRIQVLRPGSAAPRVADVIDFTSGTRTSFSIPLNVADGNWVVLRVSDPRLANAWPGPSGHPCNDFGVAYTSPWWIKP